MQERITITRQTPFDQLPEYLSVEELRTYLGLGRSLTYDLIRTGQLPCVRFGRVIRICRTDLGGMLARNSNAASGATESGVK